MHNTIISLKKAIPYIRLYKGKVFVVKIGGRLLGRRDMLDAMMEEITLLHQLGISVVLVHGGGQHASELTRRLGMEPKIIAGRRVTDSDALEVAKMVYGGSLNIDILSSLRAHQTPAVGISGLDGGLITAGRRPVTKVEPAPGAEPVDVDFGHVGDIEEVRAGVLEHILAGNFVPVVACLGADKAGNVLNINADSIAEALARALKAEKLVIMTDADGVLEDIANPGSQVSYTDIAGIDRLKARGCISGGMLPKVDACVRALKGGVPRTHIINGAKPDALLIEVFTNAGCGTMIVGRLEAESYAKELDGAAR